MIGSSAIVSTMNNRNSSESPALRALAKKEGVSITVFMPSITTEFPYRFQEMAKLFFLHKIQSFTVVARKPRPKGGLPAYQRIPPMPDLAEVASKVRAALETFSRGTADTVWQSFPNGCCGVASELLGRALIELGFAEVSYVLGEQTIDGRDQSHAWIKVGKMIVDIAADQFGCPPVIVTTDSLWHAAWATERPRAPICNPKHWLMYPHGAWASVTRKVHLETSGSLGNARSGVGNNGRGRCLRE
jgi:hypothetical protein